MTTDSLNDSPLVETIGKIITNAAPDCGHWTEWEPDILRIIAIVREHESAKATKPVIGAVSLEKCARAICDAEHPTDGLRAESWQAWHSMYETMAQAVLDTAGVKYVD